VHFSGFGWIPLVGTPPQAKASDSADLKNEDPRVRPSDEQALSVIIPIRRHPKIELFQIVRYWLAAVTPWLLLAVLLVCCLPVLMKRFRTLRRRRWAAQRGPAAVALVSYAELRDRCRDLNLGGAGLTPLEFLGRLQPDAEHEELAWLVTRLVWGDLRRDPRDADGDFARDAAQSLRKRLDAEQPLLARLLASMSRTSLREPWTEAIPGTANRLRRVRGWFVAAWHVRPHRPAALGVSR
jgi:hypothetical protein